jgi:hypothetical protein
MFSTTNHCTICLSLIFVWKGKYTVYPFSVSANLSHTKWSSIRNRFVELCVRRLGPTDAQSAALGRRLRPLPRRRDGRLAENRSTSLLAGAPGDARGASGVIVAWCSVRSSAPTGRPMGPTQVVCPNEISKKDSNDWLDSSLISEGGAPNWQASSQGVARLRMVMLPSKLVSSRGFACVSMIERDVLESSFEKRADPARWSSCRAHRQRRHSRDLGGGPRTLPSASRGPTPHEPRPSPCRPDDQTDQLALLLIG